MTEYQNNLSQLKETAKQLSSKDREISIIRFICIASFAILFYQYYQSDQIIWLITSALTLIAFALLIRFHNKIRWKARFTNEKITVNEHELQFIEGDLSSFENGEEFIKHDHPYSYDLDFFGENSLYQSLNRTSTVSGRKILANHLLHILPTKEIEQTQESVKELAPKLDWRQGFLALAKMNPDSLESYDQLITWSDKKPVSINAFTRFISYLLPIATLAFLGIYLIASSSMSGNIGGLLFLINLGVLGAFSISIKKELMDTTKIEKILKQYSFLLEEIEHQSFSSEKLKNLQSQLIHHNRKASKAIHRLAILFGRMEHVANVFASPILNGLFLYHIHVLIGLSQWRKNHAEDIKEWLNIIGEIESLNSLANFSYSNPDFVYPKLNNNHHLHFEDLGHPLLSKSKAVTNSIDFSNHRYFILTGSNMSGKSTFLRTVGVNMVLAGIGAPVYSSKANVHPLPVLVSMRLSDSLTDSESYFYAEVKRLKSIMDQLVSEPCFVLLDEILRGTNSDDKRNGTIEVIRKMAAMQAYGGIATHDLEVCKTSDEFPEVLTNKRFEVEIVDDELVFDYKLRDGICQNKSASFIMKKMGVI